MYCVHYGRHAPFDGHMTLLTTLPTSSGADLGNSNFCHAHLTEITPTAEANPPPSRSSLASQPLHARRKKGLACETNPDHQRAPRYRASTPGHPRKGSRLAPRVHTDINPSNPQSRGQTPPVMNHNRGI